MSEARQSLPVSCVSILGMGLIGASWAALFSAQGVRVQCFDPADAALPLFSRRVADAIADLEELGGIRPVAERGSIERAASVAAAVRGAGLVQECGPERLAVKQPLLVELLEATRDDVIIASSTSAHSHSELTAGLATPERIAIAHPFNPPHLVPLVEIYATEPDRALWLEDLYRALGREPIRMRRSLPGHAANRLASALWREAVHLAAEGVASVEDIDRLLVHGPAFRWTVQGAHMTYHLGGGEGGMQAYLDHLGASQEARWQQLGHPTLDDRTRRVLVEGMAETAAGRSVADLERERNRRLIDLLRWRAGKI